MIMVSENHSGNLSGSPLQFLQFPTMITTENTVKRKLKIKFASKQIEVEPGAQSCEFGQRLFLNDECDHNISVTESKTGMNKSKKFVLCSSNETKLHSTDNLMVKSSTASSHKRGRPGMVDCQKEKRQKMDRSVTQQCSSILKKLMTHPASWIFNQPVDPVKLSIPDYFSVISEPMDLGTIKTKLDNNDYFSIEEFAADVRLTFSNAMLYNPPANNVHLMAKQLDNLFNTRWKCLEAKWNRESTNVGQGHILSGRAKNIPDPMQKCHKTSPLHISLLPKRLMSAEEKKKLRKQLVEVSRGKIPQHFQGFLQKLGLVHQKEEKIVVDIDVFDDETLWALKRVITSSLNARAAKAEPAKMAKGGRHQSLGKIVPKGTDSGNKSACGSVNTKPPLSMVTSKCGSCGCVRCQCGLQNDSAHASSSDLTSEISLGHGCCDGCRTDCEAKNRSASKMSKSDPDSDGAVSALDEGNVCSSPQLSTLATAAASGEGWTPLIDVQLSPKKALRAAILKSRFADTILKAQQKTLLDHGDKADPVKMQQEKERLERLQSEEKARIEAQIRAAEAASRMRAEAELKMQREREREAARLAVQKMERTVAIDDNLESLKELEMLSGGSLSDRLPDSEDGSEVVLGAIEGGHFGKPLERLGLFIKDDDMGDEDEEVVLNGFGEEGEIFP
uniref:Putative transcription factor GTE9 isoform X1 n=1 Tax=Davidia involucrata TaxID=16924 RepID=A0A5B7AEL2_DAVIN